MIEHHERHPVPAELASFVGKVAELYLPSDAIDPCCEDITLLRQCSVARVRRAIFRNPSSLREASEQPENIHSELGDITRMSVDTLYELVVTCLPFEVRRFTNVPTLRQEFVLAQRCLDILAPNGVCLLIVPFNFLWAPLFQGFRDRVLGDMALDAVIEFPRRTMDRQPGTPAALLVIRYGPPKQCGTFFGEFGSQALEKLISALRNGVGSFFVLTDALRSRWDRHFHDPRHQHIEVELSAFETRRLEELGVVQRGNHRLREHYQDRGEFLVLNRWHLSQNGVAVSERDRYVDRLDTASFERSVVQPGDVVVSLMRPVAYVYKETDPPAVLGMNCALVRSKDNDYLATYLNTPDGQALFAAQADRHSRGTAVNALSVSDLRDFRIPIFPLEDMNSMSDAAIEIASLPELEALRQRIAQLKHDLEFSEANRERAEAKLEKQLGQSTHQRFLEDTLSKILEQQQAMNAKMDQMVRVLTSMRGDIGDIKQSSRSDEEKLTRMYARMEAFTDTAVAETRSIQEYIVIVQSWLDRWDALDHLTKKFLPSAEQLYDLLEKQPDADFSPFVIQYCRAFENEILTKLFCAYHDDFANRATDVTAFVATDLQIDTTKRFAKNVRDDIRRYTLGDMNFTMQLLKPDGRTLASSPLLQDFRKFVITYFDQRVAEKQFLDQVQHINEEFRCKAAHPYLVTKATADDCLRRVRSALSELLDSYRTETPPLKEQ